MNISATLVVAALILNVGMLAHNIIMIVRLRRLERILMALIMQSLRMQQWPQFAMFAARCPPEHVLAIEVSFQPRRADEAG